MGLFGRSRGKPLRAGAGTDEAVTGPIGSTSPIPIREESPDHAAPQMNPAGNGRARASPNGQGSAGGNGAPEGWPAVSGAPLREGLQRLFAQRPSREQFVEEALQLIATTAGVKAAAVLGYEPRTERLRLLGSIGLEPDAVEVLGAESHVNAWDMPLRGLKNQRINVIESAHENPFVPKPLVAISPRKLSIAIIPFYHSGVPIGVLVLFSATLCGFSNSLLHTISGALRVCGLALTQLGDASAASEGPSEEADQQPTLLRGLNALKAQLAHVTKELEAAERDRATEAAERVTAESFLRAERERLATLERELEAVREDRERLPTLLEKTAELTERLRQASTAGEAASAEVARLRSALEAAEEQVNERAASVAALTGARQELEGRLEQARVAAEGQAQTITRLENGVHELTERSAGADEIRQALVAAEAARASAEAELASIREELAAARAARGEIQAVLRESAEKLAASQAEVRTVTTDLAEARARAERLETQQQVVADLRREVESIETKRVALQRTIKTLRQQLADAAQQQEEAARTAESRFADLEAERDRLAAEIGRLRDQSGQTVSELHERIESIERDRREMAQRIEVLAHAESERARLQTRLEEIDQDLVAAHELGRAREARVRDLSQTTARLIAERAELQARVETLAAGGQTLEQEKQAAIAAAHRRVSQVEEELNRLTAALDASRASAASEVSQVRAAADQELRAVRGELTAATRARENLDRDVAQAQHEIGIVRQESVALAAEGERLKAELSQLGQEREATLAQSERARAVAAEQECRAAELEGRIHAALAAKDALAAQLNEQLAQMTLRQDALEQEHRAERERLLHALMAKDLLLQAAEDRLSIDVADAEEDVESMLAIERSGGATHGEAEAGPEEPAAAAEQAVTPAARELIIIDGCGLGDDTARRLAELGCRITAFAPAPDLPAQLVGRQPACAAVNLATPSAWQTVRVLRNGQGNPNMSFVAYALAAGVTTGFWFGPADFVVLPANGGELCDALARMAPRAKRVIAMSTDIDVMTDVRAQLSGKGVSAAVVLDGRQALDLLPTVRPEAAILHLSPSCADVFRAIAGLRNTDESRNIPILFLLDPAAHAQEEPFLSSGVRLLSGRGNLPSDALVNTLAPALAEYQGL